ncbi:MAG: nucleoside 2-deoxyribosyltransferase [Acidobacteriota bacterium]
MRIYLACTVRGDRTSLEAVRRIHRWLTDHGHEVLTTHLLAEDVEAAEAGNTDQEIFLRDVAWVESADLVVADASGSSYGVGFEVGYTLGRAPATGQRVCVLYRADRYDAISRLVTGLVNEHGSVHAYSSLGDIDRILQTCVGRAGSSLSGE